MKHHRNARTQILRIKIRDAIKYSRFKILRPDCLKPYEFFHLPSVIVVAVDKISISLLSFYRSPPPSPAGLECYACSNQDSNMDKCIKTTKQCEENQDTCLTHVKWGCKYGVFVLFIKIALSFLFHLMSTNCIRR